jgi:hypothetical protein
MNIVELDIVDNASMKPTKREKFNVTSGEKITKIK